MKRRFTSEEPLALDPRAFGGLFDMLEAPPATEAQGEVAVVTVRGPLEQHASFWGDSYPEITRRFEMALATAPKAIVLRVDSPGGVVSGAFDTARKLRAMGSEAGVPLYAHVEGMAASAGYALASAADEIHVSSTAIVGSIGVISAMLDVSERLARDGVRVALVKSGARKADGAPEAPLSDEALAAQQALVDSMASEFFDLVAEHRGLSADAIRALEAGVAVGAEAVRLGLADAVGSLDSLLALASGQTPDSTSEDSMDEEEEKARKALQAIVDDDDADEKAKARARKALKAMDEEDESDEPESSDGEDKEDKDESKAAAPAASAPTARGDATGYAAELQRVSAKLNSLLEERDNERREELLASRPDITDQLRATLSKAPVEEVEKILAGIPAPKRANPAAASTTVQGTRGAQPGTPGLSPEQNAAMDRAMGLQRPVLGVKREGNRLQVGAIVDWKG